MQRPRRQPGLPIDVAMSLTELLCFVGRGYCQQHESHHNTTISHHNITITPQHLAVTSLSASCPCQMLTQHAYVQYADAIIDAFDELSHLAKVSIFRSRLVLMVHPACSQSSRQGRQALASSRRTPGEFNHPLLLLHQLERPQVAPHQLLHQEVAGYHIIGQTCCM